MIKKRINSQEKIDEIVLHPMHGAPLSKEEKDADNGQSRRCLVAWLSRAAGRQKADNITHMQSLHCKLNTTLAFDETDATCVGGKL